MRQYSRDLRERALRQVDAGRPVGAVAQLFGVHRTTLLRWRQRRALGELAPRPRPGQPPQIGPAQRPLLLAQVAARPDAALAQHCAPPAPGGPAPGGRAGRARRGGGGGNGHRGQRGDDVPGAPPARLAAQTKTLTASERDGDVRAAWREEAAALDPADLLFLDETST